MKIDKTILDRVIPSGVALVSDVNMTEVDLSTVRLAREFLLTGRTVPNTTAVGSDRWLAFNIYWSDYQIGTPGTYVPLYLPSRKITTGPIPLPNLTLANDGTRYFEILPAIELPVDTITASTTTATATFINPHGLSVGDLITVSGGTTSGDGSQMQGTFPVASVTSTTVVTYTIASTTGTLVGPTVRVADSSKRVSRGPSAGVWRPKARYMYLSLDRSALDASSTIEVTANLVRVPSTAKDF